MNQPERERYQLPRGKTFSCDGSLLDILKDLRQVTIFIRSLHPKISTRFRLYEDWWLHDGLHFYQKEIGLNFLEDVFVSPKSFISNTPGEDLVYLGVSDHENTWYLRFTADTEFDEDHIIAAYAFTCIDSIARKFWDQVVPKSKAAIRIMSSDEHCNIMEQ